MTCEASFTGGMLPSLDMPKLFFLSDSLVSSSLLLVSLREALFDRRRLCFRILTESDALIFGSLSDTLLWFDMRRLPPILSTDSSSREFLEVPFDILRLCFLKLASEVFIVLDSSFKLDDILL